MSKAKTVVAMKQRLQEALNELAEQEDIIELVKTAAAQYHLAPTDVFSIEDLEACVLKTAVGPSIPYCDKAGNTWTGLGRRPAWLNEALLAGAALEDFRNPRFRHEERSTEPFCDAEGNTWSGRGRRPTWLTEALSRGADLADFKNPFYSD